MRLYFDSECLGEVSFGTTDDFWLIGNFTPFSPAERFAPLFAFLAKEDKLPSEEPPVDDDIIFGDHWTIVNSDGQSRKITAPPVHEDGQISWQWL